jgi:hypothetical protein
MPDARQTLEQLRLLRGKLCRGREMLQRAAAADPKVRAFRRDPVGRRHQDIAEAGLVHLAPALDDAQRDALPGQGAVDEDRFAADARDAATVVG